MRRLCECINQVERAGCMQMRRLFAMLISGSEHLNGRWFIVPLFAGAVVAAIIKIDVA